MSPCSWFTVFGLSLTGLSPLVAKTALKESNKAVPALVQRRRVRLVLRLRNSFVAADPSHVASAELEHVLMAPGWALGTKSGWNPPTLP